MPSYKNESIGSSFEELKKRKLAGEHKKLNKSEMNVKNSQNNIRVTENSDRSDLTPGTRNVINNVNKAFVNIPSNLKV
jgi:hypothetical protein